MPAIFTQLLAMIGPAILKAAPGIVGALILQLIPTFASKAPAVAAAVAGTTAVQTAVQTAAVPATPPASPMAPAATAPVPAASSSVITFVQEMLTNLGRPVTIDGQLGPETIGAIESSLGLVSGGVATTIINDLLSKVAPSA